MARVFSLCVTILLLVFGSISLSGADSGSADKSEDYGLPSNKQSHKSEDYGLPSDKQSHKRDIVVDNAIGGMREGSRIVSPGTYGKKTEIPKVPGTQLSPIMDTRVVAGVLAGGTSAAGAAAAGNFPGGSSSGALTGVHEGAAGAGGIGIETPSRTVTGGLEGGGATIPVESGAGSEPVLGGGAAADSGGGSLIGIDASADLSSGSIDAGVSLDTDNTDKILDADLTAGAGEAGGVTGSTDIAGGDLTAGSGLPLETTESAISSETDIGTEVDTSGGTVGGETDIGVEADVEGGSESVDVATDPADGLPAPGL